MKYSISKLFQTHWRCDKPVKENMFINAMLILCAAKRALLKCQVVYLAIG